MVRPLENQERLNTSEYVNRVRQTERGHGAAPRDFANEVFEVTDDEHRERPPSREFGEDTYEHAGGKDEDSASPSSPPASFPHSASSSDNGNLDITV